jgi:hypothetical protein
MKFQLRGHGWSVDGGRHYIPEGSIIDTADAGWAAIMQRHGSMPPLNGMPLDQATYDLMRQRYEAYQIVTMPGADGINRH